MIVFGGFFVPIHQKSFSSHICLSSAHLQVLLRGRGSATLRSVCHCSQLVRSRGFNFNLVPRKGGVHPTLDFKALNCPMNVQSQDGIYLFGAGLPSSGGLPGLHRHQGLCTCAFPSVPVTTVSRSRLVLSTVTG